MGFSRIHSCGTGLKLSTGKVRKSTITADVIDYSMVQSAQIFNSKFMYNQNGIQLYGGTNTPFFLLHKCEITYSRIGLRVKDWDGKYTGGIDTQLVFVEGEISRNRYGLMIDEEVATTVLLLNSKFSYNSKKALDDTRLYGTVAANDVEITIEKCSFFENKQALHLQCNKCNNIKYMIQDNVFRNGILELDVDGTGNLELLRNEFENNSPLEIIIDYRVNLNIRENKFTYVQDPIQLNIKSQTGTVVNVTENTLRHVYGKNAIVVRSVYDNIYFGRNAFYNATVENIIYAEKSLLSIEKNIFAYSNVNPTCLIKLGKSGSNMERTHNASLNYWGTADIAEVKARICDFFLISNQTRVRIDNIFKTPEMTSILETKNVDDFSWTFDEELGATIIGGEVHTDLRNLTFDGPVILNRSLFITEAGSFSFIGVTANITEDRGIYVLGRFSIGSNDKSRTVLRSHRNGKSWNGIRMLHPELSVKNADISGFAKLLEFKNISANLENSEFHNGGSVFFADEPYGMKYFKVKVVSSLIHVESMVIDLTYTGHLDIDIAFTNSTLHSEEGNVIRIQELFGPQTNTANLQITNSNLTAYFPVVYIRTCAGSVIGRVEQSQFVMNRYDGIYILAREHDFILHDNAFYQHVDGFKVHYCNDFRSSSVIPSITTTRQLDIARNVFSSSRSKTSIQIEAGYKIRPDKYVVNINDNVFDDKGSTRHTGVNIFPTFDLDLPLTNNTFYIRKNVFKGVKTGIKLSVNNKVYIENNTFEDGDRFIDTELADDKSTQLVINGNTVSGCSADGIVNLTQPSSSSPTVSLTNNWFVNNSQVVVSLTSPFIQILNNFFENSNATYNVRVLETSTSYAGVTANASRNYWGTDEGGAISYTIYDHDANVKLFDVDVMPFLASKNTSDVVADVGSFRIDHSLLIEGELSGSVILGARKDPYRIETDVRITTTGRLTIEPGVRMEFGQDKTIVISGPGQLVAMGTEDAPIVMTYAITERDWQGLEIPSGSASYLRHVIMNHTTAGLIVRSLNTSLQNVTVENSRGNGLHIVIEDVPSEANLRSRVKREVKDRVLVYRGVRAINNEGHGIYLHDFDASNVTILFDGCGATGNSYYGIKARADSTVEIINCEISNNGLGGLSVSQTTGSTTVLSSKFEHNNGTSISIRDTGGFTLNSSLILSNGEEIDRDIIHFSTSLQTKEENMLTFCSNNFVYNSLNGILLYLGHPKTIHLNICDNVFRGGNTAVRMQTAPANTGVIDIKIIGNDVMDISSKQWTASSEHAILSFDGSFPDSTLIINNNTFKENEAPACISITGDNYNNNFLVHIENNDFAQMTETFTAYIDIDSHPTMVLRNNRFNNTGNQCYVKAPAMLDSSYTITATHNYWGTSSEQDLMERVCGFDSYMGRSRVEYMPFFLDAELTTMKETHDEFNILKAGSTYHVSTVLVTGGEVSGEVVLAESDNDGRYVISRSIWVRKDATLTIEKGVTLELESGRGIYVDGQLNVLGEDDPVTFQNRSSRWYGIVLSSQSGNASSMNAIENAIVENTEFGIVAQTGELTIKKTEIRNVDNSCFNLSPVAKGNVDLNGILLKNCSKAGLEIRGNDEVTVSNGFIENAKVGVNATVYAGTMALKALFIRHVETTAIAVTLKPGGDIPSVTVEDCAVTDAVKGIDVIENQTFAEINVNRNTFKNIKQQAFMISTGKIDNIDLRGITVLQNNFIDVCSILITSKGLNDISFEENDVNGILCQANDDAAVLNVANDGSGGRILINYNTFRHIEKRYIINLQGSSEDVHFTGSFYNNYFIGCNATGAVVLLRTSHFKINRNSFESPDSQYDIFVDRQGSGEVDARNNWFGGKDKNEASKRIYDKSSDPSLLTVTIDPVRSSRPPDCSVIDCNSHGTCVGVICVCYPGWTGKSCDTFNCRGAHRCYGNGKCVGPNQCQCSEGWGGEVCNMPYTGTPADDDDGSGVRSWVGVVIFLGLCLLLVTAIVVSCVCRHRHRRDIAYTMASSSEEPVGMSFRPDSKTSQF